MTLRAFSSKKVKALLILTSAIGEEPLNSYNIFGVLFLFSFTNNYVDLITLVFRYAHEGWHVGIKRSVPRIIIQPIILNLKVLGHQ